MAHVEFAKDMQNFATNLYKGIIAGDRNANMIFSPFSIQVCLSLAYMGAEGATAAEMAASMNYGALTKESIANKFALLLQAIQSDEGLKIANKIYVMQNYVVKAAFSQLVEKMNSEMQSLNFAQNVASAKTINDWVEERTNHKIKDLVSPDIFNGLTRIILVNAIYFKGLWMHPFKTSDTYKAPFWITPKQSIDVDTMHIKKRFLYGELQPLDAKALEMEYKNSHVSMLIILPNKRDGLASLEQQMEKIDFAEISEQMSYKEVEVALPKFKAEMIINLKELLPKLGMPTMFNNAADFSGLFESGEPLPVSKMIHKAFIEVNEEGVEAYASTYHLRGGGLPPPPKEFFVNHPFIYFLHLKQNHMTMFSGSIIVPHNHNFEG